MNEFVTAGSQNSTYNYTEMLDWIFPVTINIVLTTLTIWIIISLIHYGIKNKKWKNIFRKNREKLRVGAVHTSMIMCGVMCIFRYISSLLAINTGFGLDKDQICNTIADLAYCSHSLVLLFTGAFLWLQQSVFYTNKTLKVAYTTSMKIFSFLCIFVIIILYLFVTIYNTVPMSYKSSRQGCIYQPKITIQPLYWIIAIMSIVVIQLMILGLLGYALIRVQPSITLNRSNSQRVSVTNKRLSQTPKMNQTVQRCPTSTSCQSKCKSNSPCNNTLQTKHRHACNNQTKIKIILTRTLILAFISLVCNVFGQLFAHYVIERNSHRRFSHMIFDISAFQSLLSLVFSFDNAKELLFSFC